MDDAVIDALRRAVSMSPDDAALRLHLADLLFKAGHTGEAVQHCALVLADKPTHAGALSLLTRASDPAGSAPPDAPAAPTPGPGGSASGTFDWQRAEADLNGQAPAFTTIRDVPAPPEEVWDVEASPLTLNDVGGMTEAKRAIELQFFGPLRHPELRQAFGKPLGGGLLMYGPPGCGKSFIARAIAGEMGAAFLNVTVADVLDMYVGVSESNMHELFLMARRRAPIVLFFDELDAIGMRRTDMGYSGMRSVTNQLLMELDGIGSDNEGVFVLAATNTPWDVDPALRRPGRFDRSVAVLPPDGPARQAVLYHHLKSRPVEGIDLGYLVQCTNGFTGADLAHLVDSAVEYAMMDSVRTGNVRMVTMQDFLRALEQIRPSAGPWFATARNIVEYGNREGEYDDLAEYMKTNNLM